MTNHVKLHELSEGARAALINTPSGRMGQPINSTTSPEVVKELARYGLIGTRDGLTKAGQILRQKAFDAALEEL